MRTALGLLFALAPFAASAAPLVADGSFESPATGSYTYDPAGTPWTYSGASGVATNGSPFYVGSAPDGTQAAFIQSGNSSFGTISQTVTGLTQGASYAFSFYAAHRSGFSANPLDITFGGVDLGVFTPTTTDFTLFTTAAFTAAGSTGLLSIAGGVTNQSDIDSAIDLVTINTVSNALPPVPEPASMAILATGLVALALRRKRA